jgi:hypothetical protein
MEEREKKDGWSEVMVKYLDDSIRRKADNG